MAWFIYVSFGSALYIASWFKFKWTQMEIKRVQFAKSILWETQQNKQPNFLNKKIARKARRWRILSIKRDMRNMNM